MASLEKTQQTESFNLKKETEIDHYLIVINIYYLK